MAYVTLIVFAVIRVISAVFLKDTLEAAQNDAEALVLDAWHFKHCVVLPCNHVSQLLIAAAYATVLSF